MKRAYFRMTDNGFFKVASARKDVADVQHRLILKPQKNIGISKPYIAVNNKHVLSPQSKRNGKIDADRCFSRSAFAGDEQTDFSHQKPIPFNIY